LVLLQRIALIGVNMLYRNFNCGFAMIDKKISYDYINLFVVFLVFECEVLVVLVRQSIDYIMIIIIITYIELIYGIVN